MKNKVLQSPANSKRANMALKAGAWMTNNDVKIEAEANLVDLLTNIRHACDKKGFDFAKLDRMAYGHYVAENRGE